MTYSYVILFSKFYINLTIGFRDKTQDILHNAQYYGIFSEYFYHKWKNYF